MQFLTGPDTTGPTRQCKITGSKVARENAKAEIARIISENGNAAKGNAQTDRSGGGGRQQQVRSNNAQTQVQVQEDENSMRIMVPNRTVGLIIGRGGETIKDLQERSGCHVNILAEEETVNGLRPVNLIGPHQAQMVAKNMILEVVDSDNRQLPSGNSQPTANTSNNRGVQLNQSAGGDAYGDKANDMIVVPSEAVGMIIGKG